MGAHVNNGMGRSWKNEPSAGYTYRSMGTVEPIMIDRRIKQLVRVFMHGRGLGFRVQLVLALSGTAAGCCLVQVVMLGS